MRHRLAAFVAAVSAVSGLSVFAPARPAAAVWVCAGQGTAVTGSPVYYPGLGPTPLNTFVFALGLGVCAHSSSGTTDKTVTASGIFLGWCGLSSGLGNLGQGDLFAWIGVGGMLVVTGHVVGVVNAGPDLASGESCTTGADRFLVVGGLVLPNCPADLGPGSILDADVWTKTAFADFHFWTNGPCVPEPLVL